MDDIGFLEFCAPRDLYVKLKHDYTILKKEPNCSNYLNFILMVDCLFDWIINDNELTETQKNEYRGRLISSNFYLFRDMSNRGKHYRLTKPRKAKTEDEYIPGFSWDNFSWDKFSWGPVILVSQDGKSIDLEKECDKIFSAYQSIFEMKL